MKKKPVSDAAVDQSSLRSRVIAKLSEEVPEGDVKSFFSRDGRLALLTDAADSNDCSNEVYVDFSPSSPLRSPLEIYVGRRRVVAGTWRTDVWANGQKLDATGSWQTLCEEIDGDGAFVERLLPLSGGRSLSRRLFVANKEKIFLNVDVLYGSDAERNSTAEAPLLKIRSTFPLDSTETNAKSADATDEVAFYDAASTLPFARVFSLSNVKRRLNASDGTLAAKTTYGGSLETATCRRGGSVCAATLFDWNANRATRPVNVGVATVGENLRSVDEDCAVGRQIQLGRERYVLYVSTSRRPAIRSILSRNLLSDFMFGKFFVGRGVEPLVDVEAPTDF
ncbi:MAG: hypothetical protein IKW13_00835 [Thermoguttaceae bacterium]|nr:hypothetical protein [Thermoguttaceae bacterium]